MLKQFHEIQKKLDKLAPLKLTYPTKEILKSNETAEQFVRKFICDYNENYPTIYVNTEKVQTEICKTRSAHDIYRVTKFYFPKVTYKDIHIILQKFACKGQLTGEYCNGVGEHVYSLSSIHNNWSLTDLYDDDGKYEEPGLYELFLHQYWLDKLKKAYKKRSNYIDIY